MLSFRGWVHEEVSHRHKYLPGVGHEVVDITFDTIRTAAEHRGRQALVTALGAEALYHNSSAYRAAIEQITKVVVAGVFGEFPLTAEEQKAKLKALDHILDNMPAWEAKIASDWDTAVKAAAKVAPSIQVTMDDVKKAGERIKAAKAGKSGLPAAQDEAKAEEEALGQLLGRVEKKSDELFGITKQAKYEELVGVDPEDI